jgi:hypothetical protein
MRSHSPSDVAPYAHQRCSMQEKEKECRFLKPPCVCFARAESCGDDVAPATGIVIDSPMILLWLSRMWLVSEMLLCEA